MSEINRLRTRLKNVQRNVTEYRMTVVEAQNLLKEIDELIAKQKEKPVQPVLNEPTVITTRILDGGAFEGA
jgi:hypothetical protein